MVHYRFFSIVIPAHNEASLIGKTLHHMAELDYPKEAYEVIVVENGSTDNTHELAKSYESKTAATIKVCVSEKGVSRARNVGLTKCSPKLDWCLFMDCDTFLEKSFLQELNTYLETHPQVGYGTTEVLLDDTSFVGRFWTHYINLTDRVLKVLHRIHIVRKDFLDKVSYDEELSSGEDMRYGYALAKQGAKYFFMKTKSVITSARRFQQKGYLTMFFINFQAGLPKKILKKKDWEVIR